VAGKWYVRPLSARELFLCTINRAPISAAVKSHKNTVVTAIYIVKTRSVHQLNDTKSSLEDYPDNGRELWPFYAGGRVSDSDPVSHNLYCVGGDVKHCTIQSNPIRRIRPLTVVSHRHRGWSVKK